jgi:hypothetical protein
VRGTGIGCYFDDPVHQVFGLQGLAFQSLYHFTVGAASHSPLHARSLHTSHFCVASPQEGQSRTLGCAHCGPIRCRPLTIVTRPHSEVTADACPSLKFEQMKSKSKMKWAPSACDEL